MALRQSFAKLPLFLKLSLFFLAVCFGQFLILSYLWTSHGAGFAQMFGLVLTPIFVIGDFVLFLFLNVVCFLRGLFTRRLGSALISAVILGGLYLGFNSAKKLLHEQYQSFAQTPTQGQPNAWPEGKIPAGFLVPPPGWPSASYSLSSSYATEHGYSMVYHKQGGDTVVTLREDTKDILGRCKEPYEFTYGEVSEKRGFEVEGAGNGVVFTVKAPKPQFEVALKDNDRCLTLSVVNSDLREFSAQNIIEDLQSFPRSP